MNSLISSVWLFSVLVGAKTVVEVNSKMSCVTTSFPTKYKMTKFSNKSTFKAHPLAVLHPSEVVGIALTAPEEEVLALAQLFIIVEAHLVF